MKTYIFPDRKQWPEIMKRPAAESAETESVVSRILKDVKERGDSALFDYTRQFDKTQINDFKVSKEEIGSAGKLICDDLKMSINTALKNIGLFHRQQNIPGITVETMPGVVCRQKSVPIEKVGLYVPGGSAPLISSVLMLGVPSLIAGCNRRIICTPPGPDGKIHPAILYAAAKVKISEIYKVGGAQAIAAMAYGTESVPECYKIFGPGNRYVTVAKQLISLDGKAMDMPAGPSELLVIADKTSVPEFIAADLLSQAEHGADSHVVLVTTDRQCLENVINESNLQIKKLMRGETAAECMKNSLALLVNDTDEAIGFANEYAPEHLMICCGEPADIAEKVINAGSVFIGNYTPVSAGDYASGPNHTLPTNGYARMFGGLSVDSFCRNITFQHITEAGIAGIAPVINNLAGAEMMDAHATAVNVRLEYLRKKCKS